MDMMIASWRHWRHFTKNGYFMFLLEMAFYSSWFYSGVKKILLHRMLQKVFSNIFLRMGFFLPAGNVSVCQIELGKNYSYSWSQDPLVGYFLKPLLTPAEGWKLKPEFGSRTKGLDPLKLNVHAKGLSSKNQGGRIAQWIAFSLNTQRPWVQFSAFPKIFFLQKFNLSMLPRSIGSSTA